MQSYCFYYLNQQILLNSFRLIKQFGEAIKSMLG
jgi:hypothetical protein